MGIAIDLLLQPVRAVELMLSGLQSSVVIICQGIIHWQPVAPTIVGQFVWNFCLLIIAAAIIYFTLKYFFEDLAAENIAWRLLFILIMYIILALFLATFVSFIRIVLQEINRRPAYLDR